MGAVFPATLALSVRPVRTVSFVPELEEVPWQRMFRFSLRVQAATWGGWGNLLLPAPKGDASEDLLLWTLLDVFDADVFLPQLVRVGDLEELAPERYEKLEQDRRQELADLNPQFEFDERLRKEFRDEVRSDIFLPKDLQRLLVRRAAPLSVNGELASPPHGRSRAAGIPTRGC